MSDELPEATVIAKPNKISGVIAASVFVIALGTVVGFIAAYAAALLVVKVGLPAPKLVVGLPLVVVAAIAWGTTSALSFRDGLITAGLAVVVAVALIAVWDPPHPSVLFHHDSKVTNVEVHGGDATMTFESKDVMSEMPAAGRLFGYAVLLSALAVAACTIGHGVTGKKKR
jgi:hypothetical protein